MPSATLFRRHIAVPTDHGSWVFLLSPLLIGLFAGRSFSVVSLYLVIAALAGFLIRQPVTMLVKVWSGRRGRGDLAPASFWTTLYAAIALLFVAGLVLRGFGYVLWLAVPGAPVFLWYLLLVSRREERRQWAVEVLGCAALALAAPAAYWVGIGRPDPAGGLLWLLTGAQSAASIDYAYLRLRQRGLSGLPAPRERLRLGRTALLLAAGNTIGTIALGLAGFVPRWLFVPYAVQLAEVVRGVARPAVGLKPKAIGYRQLAVSVLFTVLFVLFWRGVSSPA